MKFVPIKKTRVVLDWESMQRELGTLAWCSEERQAYFEYAPDFISAPLPMSPFRLPVRAGLSAPGSSG
jgi:serine/threonine-protein kinase HipA